MSCAGSRSRDTGRTIHAIQEGKLSLEIRKRKLARSTGLLLCFVLAGCESQTGIRNAGPHSVVADVILTVVNRSDWAVQVFLESDTLRYVLGDVTTRAVRSFSLPSRLGVTLPVLHLLAVRDGKVLGRSDGFQVRRGEKIVWTLEGQGRGTVMKQ